MGGDPGEEVRVMNAGDFFGSAVGIVGRSLEKVQVFFQPVIDAL